MKNEHKKRFGSKKIGKSEEKSSKETKKKSHNCMVACNKHHIWCYIFNILIVVGITILMFIYLKYSKQGYEISVVGESENGQHQKKCQLQMWLQNVYLC